MKNSTALFSKPVKLIFGFSLIIISPISPADEGGSILSDKQQCVEKTVWRPGVDAANGLFVRVKECKITCSGGSTSTTCKANEKCDCECKSSGLPGCSCHPNTRLKDSPNYSQTAFYHAAQRNQSLRLSKAAYVR